MSKDYYNILGVSKDSSEADIKTAFRKKAHEFHPDKGGDEDKFKEVNEAYQVLGNEAKRNNMISLVLLFRMDKLVAEASVVFREV